LSATHQKAKPMNYPRWKPNSVVINPQEERLVYLCDNDEPPSLDDSLMSEFKAQVCSVVVNEFIYRLTKQVN
jgi:hypothetical protein